MTPFRIRITSGGGGRCYIVRAANGAVTYMSAQETPSRFPILSAMKPPSFAFNLRTRKTAKPRSLAWSKSLARIGRAIRPCSPSRSWSNILPLRRIGLWRLHGRAGALLPLMRGPGKSF